MDAEKPDLGRFDVTKEEKDKGAFKTPTIRNVGSRLPTCTTARTRRWKKSWPGTTRGAIPNPTLDPKIKKLNLTDQEKADLVEFMKACTGDFPKIETARLPK